MIRRSGQWLGKDGDVTGHGADVQASCRVEELFRDHAHDVLAYAARRTDHASAEDVVAEVFATAWRREDRVPAREPVLWLYAVARRVLANQRRSVRRRAAFELALHPLVTGQTSDDVDGRVIEALKGMRRVDREVLLLTAWEGLDARQVAEVLGCTSQAVYTRLHRARARLSDALELSDQADLESVIEVRCS